MNTLEKAHQEVIIWDNLDGVAKELMSDRAEIDKALIEAVEVIEMIVDADDYDDIDGARIEAREFLNSVKGG